MWLTLLTKKTAKQETTGEVCTDSPVHKATFTRTGKSGTGITLVVHHNVKNVHVYTHSRPSTTNPKPGLLSSKAPLSASTIAPKASWRWWQQQVTCCAVHLTFLMC